MVISQPEPQKLVKNEHLTPYTSSFFTRNSLINKELKSPPIIFAKIERYGKFLSPLCNAMGKRILMSVFFALLFLINITFFLSE